MSNHLHRPDNRFVNDTIMSLVTIENMERRQQKMACHICGKTSTSTFVGLGKCRVCGRQYCGYHGKDGKCDICRAKLGEVKK